MKDRLPTNEELVVLRALAIRGRRLRRVLPRGHACDGVCVDHRMITSLISRKWIEDASTPAQRAKGEAVYVLSDTGRRFILHEA